MYTINESKVYKTMTFLTASKTKKTMAIAMCIYPGDALTELKSVKNSG